MQYNILTEYNNFAYLCTEKASENEIYKFFEFLMHTAQFKLYAIFVKTDFKLIFGQVKTNDKRLISRLTVLQNDVVRSAFHNTCGRNQCEHRIFL